MGTATYILIGIGGSIVAFLGWRLASVSRGARRRDEKLAEELEPLAKRLEAKATVAQSEVLAYARQPQFRPLLFLLLKHFKRLDLFPEDFLTDEAQGAGRLAYWMMHPNELQAAPKEIELVERVKRNLQGQECSFLVYRYRMPEGHWAAKDGWLLGLAGPYRKGDPPYEGPAGAFSRCGDKEGTVSPGELVDWFIKMAKRRTSSLDGARNTCVSE